MAIGCLTFCTRSAIAISAVQQNLFRFLFLITSIDSSLTFVSSSMSSNCSVVEQRINDSSIVLLRLRLSEKNKDSLLQQEREAFLSEEPKARATLERLQKLNPDAAAHFGFEKQCHLRIPAPIVLLV